MVMQVVEVVYDLGGMKQEPASQAGNMLPRLTILRKYFG